MEAYAGRSLEYETDEKVYYLTVTADEKYNGWRISQTFDYKSTGKGWTAGNNFYVPTIILNRQTVDVLYINTNNSVPD